MLDEMDAQHALQTDGWTPIARLGVVRCDFFAQRSPGHQRIHGLEELVAPRGLAMLFKTRLCVGCHGKGLLLHGPVIYPACSYSGDFFSIALRLSPAQLTTDACNGHGSLQPHMLNECARRTTQRPLTVNDD